MYRNFFKRLFDLIFSSLAIVMIMPLYFLVSLLIRIEDNGPAIFKQRRYGKNETLFTMYKFRSMPINAENKPSAESKSQRITLVGKIIRRLNIDELPQLFNILFGDMSIVGPRPSLPAQSYLNEMRKRLLPFDIRPGLTGLAQVNSYDGMSEDQKMKWDCTYAENITFVKDMKIIIQTISYLLRKPPVY